MNSAVVSTYRHFPTCCINVTSVFHREKISVTSGNSFNMKSFSLILIPLTSYTIHLWMMPYVPLIGDDWFCHEMRSLCINIDDINTLGDTHWRIDHLSLYLNESLRLKIDHFINQRYQHIVKCNNCWRLSLLGFTILQSMFGFYSSIHVIQVLF